VRVALCTPYLRSRVSGVSAFVNDLEAALVERGHDVCVLSPEPGRLSTAVPVGLQSFVLSMWTLRELIKAGGRWTAIHANQPHPQSVAALLASRIRNASLVVTYHSAIPLARTPLSEWAQRACNWVLLHFADHVVFVSTALRDELGRPNDPVIPVGVALAAIPRPVSHPAPRGGGRFTFAFVGRQTESKGYFDLMQVAKQLALRPGAPPFRIVVVGEVPAEEQAARDRWHAELRGIVEDLGVVLGRRKVMEILSTADVLVLPSYREGLPLVLIEAMAVGCVPVASAVGGIPDALHHGSLGVLVAAGDQVALSQAMDWALHHAPEIERMSREGRESILKDFAFDKTLDCYSRLYEQVSRR